MLGDGALKNKITEIISKITEIISMIIGKIKEIFKNDITRRYILLGVAATCIILMVVGAVQVIRIQVGYRQSAALYEELTQFISFDPAPGNVGSGDDEEGLDEDGEEEEMFTLPPGVTIPSVDFDSLQEINPDIVGWIFLDGTPINYPVVQAEDNDYYLFRLFDGRSNPSGSIFMDYLNSPSMTDPHTILYGHHMQDGSMFAALENFMSQEFFEEHQHIFYITPEREYVILPFAGYTTDVFSSSWQLEFTNCAEKEEWIAERRERSDFVSNIEVLPAHRFVNLTTCSMTIADYRYIIVGRIMPVAR
jgi:sortase B